MTDKHITAIISGHREGRVAVASLRSFLMAVEHAESSGLRVETIFTLDRADSGTHQVFCDFARPDTGLLYSDLGDQGAARNAAVTRSCGAYIAFLDGDDLWQRSWLTRAYRFLEDVGSTDVVAHPEHNFFFEGQATAFQQIDQLSNTFEIDVLRLTNYWDALAMCHRSVHERFPYAKRDVTNGWAFEDWQWNQETLAAGIVHRIVPDTILFKRRQRQSQTIRAAANKSRYRRTPMSSYSHPIYNQRTEEP